MLNFFRIFESLPLVQLLFINIPIYELPDNTFDLNGGDGDDDGDGSGDDSDDDVDEENDEPER